MGERAAALLRRPRSAWAAGAVLLALAGCSSGSPSETPPSAGSPSSSSSAGTSPSPSLTLPTDPPDDRFSDWDVGAAPLPLRPDGLGVMRATPPTLRERRLPTADRLPPPDDERYAATVGTITPAIRRRMGATYEVGCPVALENLRYLTVVFRGFDGAAHTGELVMAASEADGVTSVFRQLFRADFPIEEMRLPTTRDLEARPTGDGNNTAAFVCRPTTGGTTFSAHAYGLALDLNPFDNPYLRGAPPEAVPADPDDLDRVVLPELASSYLDRGRQRPGMVQPDSVAVRAFARIGWSWGGAWSSLKDYQHFTATGR